MDVTSISHICCNIRDAGVTKNRSKLLKKNHYTLYLGGAVLNVSHECWYRGVVLSQSERPLQIEKITHTRTNKAIYPSKHSSICHY